MAVFPAPSPSELVETSLAPPYEVCTNTHTQNKKEKTTFNKRPSLYAAKTSKGLLSVHYGSQRIDACSSTVIRWTGTITTTTTTACDHGTRLGHQAPVCFVTKRCKFPELVFARTNLFQAKVKKTKTIAHRRQETEDINYREGVLHYGLQKNTLVPQFLHFDFSATCIGCACARVCMGGGGKSKGGMIFGRSFR